MEKILVVEDEVDVNNGICEILESAGYKVFNAYDGDEALKILDKTIPDLVISDIMMPGRNGYELLEEFQKRYGPYNIPFIFLTAKAYYDDIREGMKYGADDYLVKPFKAKELLESVDARLKKSRQQKEFFKEIANNISSYIPHELRTPLVAILGFNQLIIEQGDTFTKEEIIDMIKRIHSSLSRLHSRVEKFITYADVVSTANNKILLNETREKFEEKDVASIVAVTADELAAKHKRVQNLKLDVEPCLAPINEVYFSVALKELIENAIKFSKENSPLNIKGKIDEKREFYLLEIENEPTAEFELTNPKKIIPFFQQKRNENNQMGNGLGLPIAETSLQIIGADFDISKRENTIVMRIKTPLKKRALI